MKARLLAFLRFLLKPVVAIGGAILIAVIAVGIAWYYTRVTPTGTYVPAAIAPITQEVSVTGTVNAAENTNLSFEVPGQVASIAVAVGDNVTAGETLITLDSANQNAALEEAQAALATAQANLASLQAGTRPQQLAVDQSAVTQAEATLWDEIQSAYVSANDAVHDKADQLFTNPNTSSAEINFTLPDFSLETTLNADRAALNPVLTALATSAAAASGGTGDPTPVASSTEAVLTQISSFLDNLLLALQETPPSTTMTAAMLSADETLINTAQINITTALTTITADETALVNAQGALTLAQAGSTPQAIAAGQAQVGQAQAAVAAAEVAAGQAVLSAPISGTITAQNADLGETVAAGTPLISMIGTGGYEADAQVSENDFGELKVGDSVTVTFNAYPGVTFPATLTEIDPAATIDPTTGVASYPIKATFTTSDPRIAAGLSATLDILTATQSSALVVPSSAVITNNGTEFVYVHGATGDVETPVTVGIIGANGTTEITNGLTEGQEVLTFGASESP